MLKNKVVAKRPYLLRAYFDWLLDSDFTPYLVVDATYPNTFVPSEYVKEGQIVLNLSPTAVGSFQLTNEKIAFNARFNGRIREIEIPMGAAIAIYARETADGIMFEPESCYQQDIVEIEQPVVLKKEQVTAQKTDEVTEKSSPEKPLSHLRIVK
ncbi:ClpXP protease specificity-enhancing factor [Mergibacter septicus]|nr:ClpXP protease specificity-enhancing factor [Mergibacter septicus]AWX13591.1 ClpXP protease specificity-enhancing factor [Mergibacter septicus]